MKKKAEVIAVANQKGGTGKSTTAAAVATGLTRRGYKALLIDLDPQGNTSFSYGAETNTKGNIFFVMQGHTPAAEAIQTTGQGEIIVSHPQLANADSFFNGSGRQFILRETAVKPLRRIFDYIIIDCPPSLGTLTVNALCAADSVLIATSADVYGLQGITQLRGTIETIKQQKVNENLQVKGILLTQYNGRTTINREIRESLQIIAKEKFNSKLFNTTIRTSTKVKEAQIRRMSLYDYAPKAAVTKDYEDLIDELIN